VKLRNFLSTVLSGLLLFSSVSGIHAGAASSETMQISQNGTNFICGLEGFCAKCYWDYSQSSIGYGTKCTSSSVQPHASGAHTITKAAAETAMKNGIANTYAPRVINQTKNLNMNQNQFDALVSLAYNTGGGLNRIYNAPLTKYLRGELTESQARSQYANYIVYAGGSYNQGLHNRRIKEANLFFTTPGLQKPSYATVSTKGNQALFDVGETVIFTMTSDYGDDYWLGINLNGKRILTPQVTSTDHTYAYTLKEAGHYTVYVTAQNAWGMIDSETIEFDVLPVQEAAPTEMTSESEFGDAPEFAPSLKGDVTLDGQLNQEDLKLIQHYLQNQETFTQEQAENADINQDGLCNIFDLLNLKKILLK